MLEVHLKHREGGIVQVLCSDRRCELFRETATARPAHLSARQRFEKVCAAPRGAMYAGSAQVTFVKL